MTALENHLRTRRDSGKKLLIPYLMAGARPDWLDLVRASVDAGVDAIEIGIPFSDPVMDGPVIQEAAVRALDAGTTPMSVLDQLATLDIDTPLAVMTYYNLVYRFGLDEFAAKCIQSGVTGSILPDLPLDESHYWRAAANRTGVDNVMLVAPNTPDQRLTRICEASRGFIYAVGTLGVTGNRAELPPSAIELAGRVKAVTNTPVLVGVGISNPEQAAQAAAAADGAIIGTVLVKQVLDGDSPAKIGSAIGTYRTALDA